MNNARLYAKIMQHLEETIGTISWDFRTLNLTHPQLAIYLYRYWLEVTDTSLDDVEIFNHYMPRRLWNYETR